MAINLLNKITNSEFVNKHINRTICDNNYAAKALVALNVAKDVFAYGARFETTMKNKEIPEEKRPFVAAMDLMSGAVTAVMQIGVGFSLASPKVQDKIWDKLFKNCHFENAVNAKKGYSQLLALLGSTILAERILVPLIATPFAELFEKKTSKKKTPKNKYAMLQRTDFAKFQHRISSKKQKISTQTVLKTSK